MGNGNSSNASTNSAYEPTEKPFVQVEVIKSSSEEFPEEYAVIYTSLKDNRCRCVLRVRANREKAQFTFRDGLCLREEVWMNVEVNVLRGEDGSYRLEIQKVECSKDMKAVSTQRGLLYREHEHVLEYSCKDRRVTINVDRFTGSSISSSLHPGSALVLCHKLFAPANSEEGLVFPVSFTCNYFEGLVVEMLGPLFGRKLYIDRMVEENPEDCSNFSIIKTKYRFLPNKGKRIVAAASYLSATGAINNVNSETHGKFNNSVNSFFTDCHFYG
ncbi:hypothetical protein L6164_003495 [Bauhinia variegata]|uniref:Uncharacterized protein n=1 Tax=Bauhinia variegata TaxID=167791 RepID=A0ACB9Q1N2_BAUVA|nr:hypothetical protein L6164_003495 [Bauhinia variegata]